jgi:phage portal protein BeeE
MYQNQGVKGVLYIDDPRVLQNGVSPADTKKQMDAVKGTLAGEWTGADNFGKIGTSGYKMGWQEMGLSPVDLNIIEAEKWDYIGLCNIYGVPPELLGLTAKTYNNVKEAESALTSRVAMPQLVSYRDELNRYLQTYTAQKNKGIIVDFDQTCFTELQEDLAAKWGWIKELPISPNSKLMQMGMETNEAKEFDEVWITPAMGMPLSEWNMQDNTEPQNTQI